MSSRSVVARGNFTGLIAGAAVSTLIATGLVAAAAYAYQWSVGEVAVVGATLRTYRVVAADTTAIGGSTSSTRHWWIIR